MLVGTMDVRVVVTTTARPSFSFHNLALLKSIPGVGRILGLVMLYEIEDIARFPREQDFASYLHNRLRRAGPNW